VTAGGQEAVSRSGRQARRERVMARRVTQGHREWRSLLACPAAQKARRGARSFHAKTKPLGKPLHGSHHSPSLLTSLRLDQLADIWDNTLPPQTADIVRATASAWEVDRPPST